MSEIKKGEPAMERDEILEKYRREGVDEGREEANRRGDDAGFYAMCVLALLLMLYQAFAGQVFGDVAAVLFVFSSVGSFARYRTDRDRFFLGMGIFTGVLCLGCLGWYLWHTL
ncbi:DUF6442 family protein [Oscillibacter valericigenes]|uniref:Transporter n=2 Tax=Oscillibacter TaxID=459786 RepID=A0ABS2FWS2_9FIRM|nr:DUF6442 family protein [Oscillibacter valericigenes]MBM6851760.1 hypothetical protein [Oscillibacter valericigenes]MBM6911484.1 hypothetical protein [Oscillibacter valericigenes]